MTDALRSIKYPKVRRGIIVVSFIILVIWIIVVVLTVLKDPNALCGSNHQLNLFTYVALPIAFIGLFTYWKSVDSQLKLQAWLRRVPLVWDYLMDSGDTPYFNPNYYKLKNGRYAKVMNNTIESDEFGLPIVDDLVPLNSFNMNIYRKYHKPIFDEINGYDSPRFKAYPIFKKYLLDHIRIVVVGRTCMIVKSWSGEYLLIHKSKYFDFINDQKRSTRWEDVISIRRQQLAQTEDRIDGLQHFINRLNGMPHSDKAVARLVAKHSTIIPSITTHYEPLLKEMANVYISIPSSIAGLKDVVKQLLTAPKKPFAAPLLTTKHLELKLFELINDRVHWSTIHQYLGKLMSTSDTLKLIELNMITPDLFNKTTQEDSRLIETKRDLSISVADLIEGHNFLNDNLTRIGKTIDRLYTGNNANYIVPIRVLYQYNNDQLKSHLRAYISGWTAIHGKIAKTKSTLQNFMSKFKHGPVTNMGLVSSNVDNPDDPIVVADETGEDVSYKDTGIISSVASVLAMPGNIMKDLVASISAPKVEQSGIYDQAIKSITLANNPELIRNLQLIQQIAEKSNNFTEVEEKKAQAAQEELNRLTRELHKGTSAINEAQKSFPKNIDEMFNTEQLKALHMDNEQKQIIIREQLNALATVKQESNNHLRLANDKQRELEELRGDVNVKAKQLIDVTSQTVKNFEQLQSLSQKLDEKEAALIAAKSKLDLEESKFRAQNINDQQAIKHHEAEQDRLNQKIRQAKLEKDQAEHAALEAQSKLEDSAKRTASVEEALQQKTSELQVFNEQSQQMLGQIASLTTSLESFEEKNKQMLNKNVGLWVAKKIGDKKQQKLIEQHEVTQDKLKKEIAHATAESFMSKVNLAALDAQYKAKDEKEKQLKKEIDTKRRVGLLKAEAKKVAALSKLSKNNQALLQQYEQTKTQQDILERAQQSKDTQIAELMSSLQSIQTENAQLASTQLTNQEKEMEQQRLSEQLAAEQARIAALQEDKNQLVRDAASYQQLIDAMRGNIESYQTADAENAQTLVEAQKSIDEKIIAQAEVARVQALLEQNEQEKRALKAEAQQLQQYRTQIQTFQRDAELARQEQQAAFTKQLKAEQAKYIDEMEDFKAQCIPIIANLQKFVKVSIEAISVRDKDTPITINLTNELMIRLLNLIKYYYSVSTESTAVAKPISESINKLLLNIFGKEPKTNYLSENLGKELTLLYSIYKIIDSDPRFAKAFIDCENCRIDLTNDQIANQYKFLSNCKSFIAYSKSVFDDNEALPYVVSKSISDTVIKSTNFPINSYNDILIQFTINGFVLPEDLAYVKNLKTKVESKKTNKTTNPQRPPREVPTTPHPPTTQPPSNLTPRRPPPLPPTQEPSIVSPRDQDSPPKKINRTIKLDINGLKEIEEDITTFDFKNFSEANKLIEYFDQLEIKDDKSDFMRIQIVDLLANAATGVNINKQYDYSEDKENILHLINKLKNEVNHVERTAPQLNNNGYKASSTVIRQVREEGNTNPPVGKYHQPAPPFNPKLQNFTD